MSLHVEGAESGVAEARSDLDSARRTPAPSRTAPVARRQRVGLGLAVLLSIGAGGGGYVYLSRPPAVSVAALSRGPAVEAVYATGVVEAIDFARVGTTVAGRIVELPFDEGMAVKRGDVIARLDDRQARARLEDARARLKTAQADIARATALLDRGVVAAQALEHAQQESEQATAAVDLCARQLEDLTILSPLDGVVMKRDVELGEAVAVNVALIEISSTARKRIAADVDERDFPSVKFGGKLIARADGFPDQAFVANVTNIRAQGDTASRTFRVEADLPADTPLAIGMTVDVNIVIGEREAALLAPAAAVQNGPSQGGRPGPAFVYVVRAGVADKVGVRVGAVGGGKAEIVSGLDDRDRVIVDPPAGLRDGAAVRVSP